MNEFSYDDINSAISTAKQLQILKKAQSFQQYVIVADRHSCVKYFAALFLKIAGLNKQVYVSYEGQSEEIKEFLSEYDNLDNLIIEKNFEEVKRLVDFQKKTMYLYFCNVRNGHCLSEKERSEACDHLENVLNSAGERDTLLLLTAVPRIYSLPEGFTGVMEREYEILFRTENGDTEEDFVIRLEDCCRKYIDQTNIKVGRLDSIFGPEIEEDEEIWVNEAIRQIKSGTLIMKQNDNRLFRSALYIRDALIELLLVLTNGRKGNIYHLSSWEISRFQICSELYGMASDYPVKIECAPEEDDMSTHYAMLGARKIYLLHSKSLASYLHTTKKKALQKTFLSKTGVENYVEKNQINLYYGKIDRIRREEVKLLQEVDRICKKYNIKYFLAGGTLLGAIRHKGFIPWDDDLDIGMLPEDYYKFLSIAPKELDSRYFFQDYTTEDTSHYVHDKIRIKNTFFSTKYSNRYAMHNGVYIDIFVYFKTSDNPKKQKKHLKKVQFCRKLIAWKWGDKPRKGKYKTITKWLMPVIRKVPFQKIHELYMHTLGMYEKKDTHSRIDGMGFNLTKVKAFPAEWFDEIIETEFEGVMFPVIARYDDYLKHWYGEKYMEWLPLSGRKSVHDVVRIDLGEYITDENIKYRDVDIRGELFETKL